MSVTTGEIFEVFECTAEMTDAAAGMVPLSPELVAEITEGDPDPKFGTFIIESGWSNSKRYWGPELFDNVAEQVNAGNSGMEPLVAYLGHIKPDDDPYTFPEIQMQWVKARVQKVNGRARLAVKAYLLPGSKARQYVPRLVKTVSWRGKALMEPFEKGVRVREFQIESIDLSRPRKAGMSARLAGALTSEMEEGGNSVKPEEIAALQENELRAHAPALVTTIETAARKPLETQVSEMETAAAVSAPALEIVPQLRAILGLDDKADDATVLSKALAQIKEAGKSIRDSLLASVLKSKKLDGDPLLVRLITSEMRDKEFDVTGDDDKDEATVGKIVGEIVDADDGLKKLVSEMEARPPSLPSTPDRDNNGNSTDEWKPGHKTSNVRVKTAR